MKLDCCSICKRIVEKDNKTIRGHVDINVPCKDNTIKHVYLCLDICLDHYLGKNSKQNNQIPKFDTEFNK